MELFRVVIHELRHIERTCTVEVVAPSRSAALERARPLQDGDARWITVESDLRGGGKTIEGEQLQLMGLPYLA